MKKFYTIQKLLLKEISKYEELVKERDIECDWERLHISSCAKVGYMLAEERGFDSDIAACACAVHDYGRIVTGKQENHGEVGYEYVKNFLISTDLFNEKTVEEIAISTKNHSKKGEIGGALEEIVKDADILDYYQYGNNKMRMDQRDRLERLLLNK